MKATKTVNQSDLAANFLAATASRAIDDNGNDAELWAEIFFASQVEC